MTNTKYDQSRWGMSTVKRCRNDIKNLLVVFSVSKRSPIFHYFMKFRKRYTTFEDNEDTRKAIGRFFHIESKILPYI